MSMRTLVTGGAGFIGSHLVHELLLRGDNVRVFDDFSSGRRENLAPWINDIEIMAADLRDPEMVKKAVTGMDWVFHLAAFISVPQSLIDPETCFAINVTGTVNILEASRKAGVGKVILASSTAVYGNTSDFPTTEESRLQPLSPYATSKQVTELYALLYTRVFNLPVVALRFFNVYGPRQRPDSPYAAAIPIFINQLVSGEPITIFGDGKQSRDFIYVKDVVRGMIMSAGSGITGDIFNICSGQETTLLDLLDELSELAPNQPQACFVEPRPGDIYRSLGSPAKALKAFGFQAQTSLGEGLHQTINWMQER